MSEADRVTAWGERGTEYVRQILERDGLTSARVFLLATRDPDGKPYREPMTVSMEDLPDEAGGAFTQALAEGISYLAALAVVLVLSDRERRVAYFFWPINSDLTDPGRVWYADVATAGGVTVCGEFREGPPLPLDAVRGSLS